MARSLTNSQQKFAEKLIILNERGHGLLTLLYNIKKSCGESNKSLFLPEKLESCIKLIVKKFPSIDIKGNMNTLSPLCLVKEEIMKNLNQYYLTFVDLLEFKDHVTELLTNLDTAQMNFDIVIYFDITKLYLDLIVTYISLIFLLNTIDDRKTIVGLYNTARELTNNFIGGSSSKKLSITTGPDIYETNEGNSYPRLAQTLADYDGIEPALKKLQEEFSPHARLILKCISSLLLVFPRRNLTAVEWRSAQMLSLVASSQHLLTPAQTDTIPCEYLSLERMEKWIILCGIVCHQALILESELWELWKVALRSSIVIPLFRDETINVFTLTLTHFDAIKGIKIRKERRKFLRVTLKELAAIFRDQPGLLGPKALYVFMALSFTRDEILWLIRHQEHCISLPLGGNGVIGTPLNALNSTHSSLVNLTKKISKEDFIDRILPELLFYIEELKGLVKKYHEVLQRYYVQYLSGYDAMEFKRLLQSLSFCQEEESLILTSFDDTLSKMSLERLYENQKDDFKTQNNFNNSGFKHDSSFPELKAFRLDWMRLQAYSSPTKATFSLSKIPEFAKQLNMITFHTKMVDNLDSMLAECSDLSLFCFYPGLFEENFRLGLEFPPQMRYIISYPMICSHFIRACHDMCPEETPQIIDRSLMFANMFLDDISKEIRTIVAYICEDYCLMNDQVLPKNAMHVASGLQKKVGSHGKKKSSKLLMPSGTQSAPPNSHQNSSMTNATLNLDENKPGSESYRRYREELNVLDIQYTALTELCTAIDYQSTFVISHHTFAPREYLTEQLELYFNKSIVAMAMYNLGSTEIARPSEVLSRIRTCMSLLFHTMENFVHLDLVKILKNVLLQQTQPLDNHGEKTIASIYTVWYLEILLRRSTNNSIIFSDFYKCFVTFGHDEQMKFSTEEYVDFIEIKALAELLTAYGMRHLSEQLMRHVASQIMELRKVVVAHKELLILLRTNFEDGNKLKDFNKKMSQSLDGILQRLILIGKLIAFNSLAMESLNDVLQHRAPFLLTSITDFQNVNANSDITIVNEMATAAGIESPVNPFLAIAIKQNIDYKTDEEHEITCLMMVLVALSFPRLVKADILGGTTHHSNANGARNNAHCLAKGLDVVFSTVLHLHGKNDLKDRHKEFLALSSSCLLRICHDSEKENISYNRDTVCLILEEIVNLSSHLSHDLLDACFPYILIQNACNNIYKNCKF